MSGAQIAAEVAAALTEAGEATGTGPLICTIRRMPEDEPDYDEDPANPWDEADPTPPQPNLYSVNAIESVQDVRDMSGSLIGVKKRTLTVNATGVPPLTSDKIAVGVAPEAVTSQTVFEEILAVTPLSPAGTALLYELSLAV